MVYLFRRFAAYYIDNIILFVLVLFVYIFQQVLFGVPVSEIDNPRANLLLCYHLLIGVIYFSLFEFYFQRTVGKMALKFKIEGMEEFLNAKRFIQVLKRTISRFIPLEPFSILLDENREMWHDKISKTKVVDMRNK